MSDQRGKKSEAGKSVLTSAGADMLAIFDNVWNGEYNTWHTALTATAISEKLTTQTEHILALYKCREAAVLTQKSNRKIGPFSKSSFLLVF